jgi:FAD/FMN-containing dehydrogenase
VSYDGSIAVTPQQLVYPESVEEIQAILRDSTKYPSPVRAMGSFHSLTPCPASTGTVIGMKHMSKVLNIDEKARTLTAEAGVEFIDASHVLRERNLQFMTNIEIGNMTLGSAACCHSKDALDGIEFGQVSSYASEIKWVTPSGKLAQASDDSNPDLLRIMRSSYGLGGVIYEVTFRVKPIEALHFTYLPRPVAELTEDEVNHIIDTSEGLVCWTVGRTAVFQQRHKIDQPGILASLQAAIRRHLWNHTGASAGRIVDQFVTSPELRNDAEKGIFDFDKLMYETLHLQGGITLLAPDKTVDYRETPPAARYAFTFWAFPKEQWFKTYREYLDFADDYHSRTGFRCNMPLGAYFVRKDQHSLLSYTNDRDMFSIDPIHASTNDAAWQAFLREFNQFAYQRGGAPLLNQSPFVERKHAEAAFGDRWKQFSAWVKSTDPEGRMLNPFFADLLSTASGSDHEMAAEAS